MPKALKKSSKELQDSSDSALDMQSRTVYLGRIPHGFYEPQMRAYFSQFGTVTRLRLSRNPKTSASRHYAFIEFESEAVARIVARTMDNYLLFGHLLKCKVIPTSKLHPDMFKGKRFTKTKNPKESRVEKSKKWMNSKDETLIKNTITRINTRQQERIKAKARKLKSMGIDFDLETIPKGQIVIKPQPKEKKKQTLKEDWEIEYASELLELKDKI